tara:strand:- start:48 stop:881 length:834 start_codon:yes stop_codon:yes gene_type:complete
MKYKIIAHIFLVLILNSCSTYIVSNNPEYPAASDYPYPGFPSLMNASDCINELIEVDSLDFAEVYIENKKLKRNIGYNLKKNKVKILSKCYSGSQKYYPYSEFMPNDLEPPHKILDSIRALTIVKVNDVLYHEYNNGFFISYYHNGHPLLEGRMHFDKKKKLYTNATEGDWAMWSADGLKFAVGTPIGVGLRWSDVKIYDARILNDFDVELLFPKSDYDIDDSLVYNPNANVKKLKKSNTKLDNPNSIDESVDILLEEFSKISAIKLHAVLNSHLLK